MLGRLAVIGILAVAGAGCEPVDDPVFIKGDKSLTGTWTGTAEITTADDIGSGATREGGTVFTVLLDLKRGGRFELITSNYPTSFTKEFERTCVGTWEREGNTLELFAFEACRALPFSKYTIGRTLPDGITLDASTAFSPVHTPGSIRVRLLLDRT